MFYCRLYKLIVVCDKGLEEPSNLDACDLTALLATAADQFPYFPQEQTMSTKLVT